MGVDWGAGAVRLPSANHFPCSGALQEVQGFRQRETFKWFNEFDLCFATMEDSSAGLSRERAHGGRRRRQGLPLVQWFAWSFAPLHHSGAIRESS